MHSGSSQPRNTNRIFGLASEIFCLASEISFLQYRAKVGESTPVPSFIPRSNTAVEREPAGRVSIAVRVVAVADVEQVFHAYPRIVSPSHNVSMRPSRFRSSYNMTAHNVSSVPLRPHPGNRTRAARLLSHLSVRAASMSALRRRASYDFAS
jgi:hypothetical protein